MKTLLLSALLLGTQTLKSERAIVADRAQLTYCAPAVVIGFDIEFEQVDEYAGMFHQYAERYLGVKAAIEEDRHYFRLTKITPSLSAVADTARRFTLSDKFLKDNTVSFYANRCLAGVNLPAQQASNYSALSLPEYAAEPLAQLLSPMPLHEEQLLAGSTGKMAEGAAKMIYRLRETRMNLLLCDVENMPSDSKTIEMLLENIDKEEQRLTAMFLGTRTVTTHTRHICFFPQSTEENTVLFRFSTKQGAVDSDDLIGEPYYLTFRAETIKTAGKDGKQYVLPTSDIIAYTVPSDCELTLTDLSNRQLLHFSCRIPQLGVMLPLPQELIRKKAAVSFDSLTGDILEISITTDKQSKQ